MRKLIFIGLAQMLLVLGGCGGGSGVVPSNNNNNNGNGNGNGGGGAANVVSMVVDAGPDPTSNPDVDTPFISVTVCAPGSSSNCVTIPDVEVDTGSYGLRIISSAFSSTFIASLTQENASNGSPLVECTQFVDGYSWGPVMQADVHIGGESASGVPIQVIGDPSFENEIPSACSGTGTQEDTVATFGANGIIGVGPFAQDCGSGCVLSNSTYAANPWYYACPAGGTANSCQATGPSVQQQVTNPVADFTATGDDNGVIIELPSIPDPDGTTSVTGSLIFGIGTQGNNVLSGATVLTGNRSTGDITTTFSGTNGSNNLPDSYLDTGSNAYYFDVAGTTSIPDCPSSGSSGSGGFSSSWVCPASEQTINVTNSGANGMTSNVSIKIYNANTLFAEDNGSFSAFDDLGADTGAQGSYCGNYFQVSGDCYFDFGLPFFFGRNVYVAIEGTTTQYGNGPFFAY